MARVLPDESIERLERLKLELCKELKKALQKRRWDQRTMAIHMRTSRARVSEIETLKVEKLTVGQLFRYLAAVEPNFRILISI